ncbi:hypothetical protein HAT86_12070 [Roseovarius gahaiensis]|uniref:Uncharacterized protein n=1 Tax=Roseovarius gahaiensis TaxID=2716691 RepID=A0A967BIB4_9RHOB|nr:hypothetical protein [Roseovarius gahaiensis]NHQ75192.1 hypothetical protein [Roseovarius gahaiensis]
MTRTPEARLWQSVLTAGLHDAAKGKDAGWIGSSDFQLVCVFTGLDPEAVAERFDADRFRRLIKAA